MGIRRKKEVEIFLLGGLGNQLFGWAAGMALAKRFEAKLILNTSQLSSRDLAIPERLLHGTAISNKSPLYYRCNSKFLKRIYRNLPLTNSYFEKEYSFENRFNKIRKPIKLNGFFQSRDYFHGFDSTIFKLLSNEDNLTQQYKKVRSELPEKFISIHFRRGDYIDNTEFHPLIGKLYYEKALSRLCELGLDAEKVVFTDDEILARELFPTYPILSQNDLIEPFDNIILMSQGEAIIGANSSFSLWAGFLLNAKGGTCIFPYRWFGSGFMENLSPVPPEFLRI